MLFKILIAIAVAYVIWRVSTEVIRMLATAPPEPDPLDVIDTYEHFRCSVCGTEVTMTIRSNTEEAHPRHCREEMTLVWRPA